MTIASAITAAQGRVADCYTAISNKGGTLPATQNLSNMPAAIASIPSGGGQIIENFTTFGSPTIDENHVLSNLSNSNYVSIDKITPAASFDMIVPIKISSTPSSTQVILGTTAGAPNIYMENGSRIHCWTGSAGASGSTSMAINTKYWLRIVYDGSYSRVYLLQDNSYTLDTLPSISSWTQQFSFSGGVYCQKSFFLGKTQDGSAFSSGSFYLDETIIKSGSDTYWTPYETL